MNARDQQPQVAEYRHHLATAADALLSAIETGVTDGGEAVSHLLATVAANLGGLHQITKARPGSWEAAHVSQFLASTVGPYGEHLMQYRTRPVEIVECVDLAMIDQGTDPYDKSFSLIDSVEADAANSGDDAASERIENAGQLLDNLRLADYATYREEFEKNVRDAAQSLVEADRLNPDLPVSVRWIEWNDRGQTTGSLLGWNAAAGELWEAARTKTAPPGSSESANGLAPHERIPELAAYAATSSEPGAE